MTAPTTPNAYTSLRAKCRIRTRIRIFWTEINAVSPYVLNGNASRTLYARVMIYPIVSRMYPVKLSPAPDFALTSFNNWGNLTTDPATTIPNPRTFDTPSFKHSG